MQQMENLIVEYHRSGHGYLTLRLFTGGKTSVVYANRMGTSHLLILLGREGTPVMSEKRRFELLVPKYLADLCSVIERIPKNETLTLLKSALSGKSIEKDVVDMINEHAQYDATYTSAMGGKEIDISRRGYTVKLAGGTIEKNKDAIYMEFTKGGAAIRFCREENPDRIRGLFMKALKNPSGFLIDQVRRMLTTYYWSGHAVVLSVSGTSFVPSSGGSNIPNAQHLTEDAAKKIVTSIKTGAPLPIAYLLS